MSKENNDIWFNLKTGSREVSDKGKITETLEASELVQLSYTTFDKKEISSEDRKQLHKALDLAITNINFKMGKIG